MYIYLVGHPYGKKTQSACNENFIHTKRSHQVLWQKKKHITVTRSLHLLRWALVHELGPKYCFFQWQYLLCNIPVYNSGLILYINNINQKTVKSSWLNFMFLIVRHYTLYTSLDSVHGTVSHEWKNRIQRYRSAVHWALSKGHQEKAQIHHLENHKAHKTLTPRHYCENIIYERIYPREPWALVWNVPCKRKCFKCFTNYTTISIPLFNMFWALYWNEKW